MIVLRSMTYIAFLLALPMLVAQEKPSHGEIRALIQQLRSDSIQVRKEATYDRDPLMSEMGSQKREVICVP